MVWFFYYKDYLPVIFFFHHNHRTNQTPPNLAFLDTKHNNNVYSIYIQQTMPVSVFYPPFFFKICRQVLLLYHTNRDATPFVRLRWTRLLTRLFQGPTPGFSCSTTCWRRTMRMPRRTCSAEIRLQGPRIAA